VPFEAKDVINDPAALRELQSLGFKSVPVTLVGNRVAVGFNPRALCQLLGLRAEPNEGTRDVAWFQQKLEMLLDAMVCATRQLSPSLLDLVPQGSQGTLRELIYHALNQPWLCIKTLQGIPFTHEALTKQPEEARRFKTPDELAKFGQGIIAETSRWAKGAAPADLQRPISTHFGEITFGELLDVSALGHAAHHLRQMYAIFGQLGIEPESPLKEQDLKGIPVPTELW